MRIMKWTVAVGSGRGSISFIWLTSENTCGQVGFPECSHGRMLFVWIDKGGISSVSPVLTILGGHMKWICKRDIELLLYPRQGGKVHYRMKWGSEKKIHTSWLRGLKDEWEFWIWFIVYKQILRSWFSVLATVYNHSI